MRTSELYELAKAGDTIPENPYSRAALGDLEFLRAFDGDLAALEDVNGFKMLLGHGADPDAVDDDGQTALDLAREKGRSRVIALLKMS